MSFFAEAAFPFSDYYHTSWPLDDILLWAFIATSNLPWINTAFWYNSVTAML
jgi:hypothetical protein